jgi:hypothetical protein
VVAAVLAAPAAAVLADDVRLSLGVLRRDGVLIPFASYDRGKWSVEWPGNPRGLSLPISLGTVPRKWWGPQPPSTTWRAMLPGGSVELTLRAPLEFRVFCSTRFGVTTSYRGGEWEIDAPTVPKDAIAIAGDAEWLAIDRVDVSSPAAEQVRTAIAEEFEKQEKIASESFARWKHPIPAAERKKIPIRLETYYRSEQQRGDSAWTASYIEAVREFPAGAEG